MEDRSEIQWRDGVVFTQPSSAFSSASSEPTHHYSSSLGSNETEAWNDQEILDVFDAAIRSHRSKGKKKEQSQSKKEIRSPKNVHFATGHDENILIDPLDEELPPSLPTNNRWREDSQEEPLGDRVVFTNRLPRVNFDLETTPVGGGSGSGPESTTHTDTEGSDGGNGAGSDSSASVNKKTGSSRRRQLAGSQSTTLKKKQLQQEGETVEHATAAAPAPSQPQTTQQQPPVQQPQPQLYPQAPPSLPTPPLPFLSSNPPTSQFFNPHAPAPAPPAQTTHSHGPASGSGAVAPEMECLLTDMLMAWYQSGYTTGRYYAMLEQQQQQTQQWFAYYQQQQGQGQGNGYSSYQQTSEGSGS